MEMWGASLTVVWRGDRTQGVSILGPVDLRDWDFGEDDLLRAEIRILAEPRAMGAMGPDVSRRLIDFNRGVDFGTVARRRLCADLKAAS
jgi:hypothetical protein